jgi:hypothetical protein
MILCETRGLQLFWVVRGGIGLKWRLGAELQHTERLTTYSILSLEPERRKNRWATTRHETWEFAWVSLPTLKLLALSDVLRRNVLPSSKVSS